MTPLLLAGWGLIGAWWWRSRPPTSRLRRDGGRHAPAGRRRAAYGIGSLAALALLPHWSAAALGLVACGVLAPRLSARRRSRRQATARRSDVLLLVALLEIALHGGVTIRRALEEVHGWLGGELAGTLHGALRAADHQGGLAEHLEAAAPELRRLSQVVRAAERHGAPAAAGLASLAAELRLEHRHELERHARRLPVRLLAPLVGGVLPAFALLTVVPMLSSALGSLRLVQP
jgi:hypothetical protein